MKVAQKYLGIFGSLGAMGTAALAPCCFPVLGVVAGTLGLGVAEKFAPALQYLVQVFMIISVIGSVIVYRSHLRRLPVFLALAGALLGFVYYYGVPSETLIYGGFGLLLLSGILSTIFQSRVGRTALPILESTLTCPECGQSQMETMPTNACWYYWDCPECGVKLKPKTGDCCVFCSFGSIPCPPIQLAASCCTTSTTAS